MIIFYVKPNTHLKQYGFEEDKKDWVLWRGTRRLWVSKRDNALHFNMITNEVLSIFYRMIKDDVVIYKDKPFRPCNYHYVGLSDEEYEEILKKRGKL